MAYRKTNRKLTPAQTLMLHAQGVGCRELAERTGISARQMNDDLHRLGIVLRHDRPWLDVIDSDTKAYALGFLWADGCIERNTTVVAVQDRDLHMLEALQVASGFGKIIQWRFAGKKMVAGKMANCRAMLCLRWNSKQMRQALQRHGLCYNKMKVLPAVVLPPVEHMRGFVRGLVDGDGHLTLRSNGDVIVGFSNHNESLLNAAADYFGEVSGKRPRINASQKGSHLIKSVCASGPAAVAVARDLYLTDTTSIAIDRKREKALLLVQWLRDRSLPRAA